MSSVFESYLPGKIYWYSGLFYSAFLLQKMATRLGFYSSICDVEILNFINLVEVEECPPMDFDHGDKIYSIMKFKTHLNFA